MLWFAFGNLLRFHVFKKYFILCDVLDTFDALFDKIIFKLLENQIFCVFKGCEVLFKGAALLRHITQRIVILNKL